MSERLPLPLDTLLAHRAFVTALAQALVRDPAAADDLAQQAWVAAMERPPISGGSVRGWFARVLRNARRDAWRTDARRARREQVAPQRAPEPSPDEIVARAEIHRQVVLAVFALDEPQRTTVILRFFEGLDATEIAARQGVPPATVRKRLERALDQLRERLDADHGGDRAAWIAAVAPLASAVPEWAGTAAGAGSAPHASGASATSATEVHAASSSAIAGSRPAARLLTGAAALVLVGLGAGVWFLAPDDWTTTGTPGDGTGAERGRAGVAVEDAAAGRAGRAQRVAGNDSTAGIASSSPAAAVALSLAAADLTVSVRTPTGDPAAGATVKLLRMPREPRFVNWALEFPDPPSAVEVASATTDADGRATLTGLVRGSHVLTAEAPGLAPPAALWVTPGARSQSWELLLRRAGVVTGLVMDGATGAPVVAEVVVRAAEDVALVPLVGTQRFVATAADGTFRVEGVPAGRVIVGARRPGGLVAASTVAYPDGVGPVELRLAQTATVEGIAIDDSTDEPVEGAALDAILTFQQGGFSPARARVVTGQGGHFRLPGVPVGSAIRVVPADDGPWKAQWDRAGTTSTGGSCEALAAEGYDGLRVRLLRPSVVEGVVTTSDGRPAADAEVIVIGDRVWVGVRVIEAGVALAQGRTDARGCYRIDGLAPGRIEVFARSGDECAELWMTADRRMKSVSSADEDDARPCLAAGERTRVNVRLVAGRAVAGSVQRGDGSPVADADVVTANRHVTSQFAAMATTDADGRFVLHAIPPGDEPLVVSARVGTETGRVDVADGVSEVTIRLDRADATNIALAGRIVGPDGDAVPSARLVLVETPGDDDTLPARYGRHLDRGGSRTVPVRADGTFSVDRLYGLQRDRMLLVASARGFLPGAAMVPVRPGARVENIRVALRRGAEVRGVLRDAAGSPLAGVPVRAVQATPGTCVFDGTPPTAATAADGAFRLVVEPDVSVSIVFGAIGDEVLSLPSAPPGESLVEARLPANAKPRSVVQAESAARAAEVAKRIASDEQAAANYVHLTGRVVGPDGKAISNADVRHVVTDASGRRSTGSTTDAAGRFSMPLPPGAVGALHVDARERGVAVREGVAAGGGDVEIRVVLRTEPVLRGVVRDASGRPIAGVAVVCRQETRRPGAAVRAYLDVRDHEPESDRHDLRTLRTAADGAYSVATLPLGKWTIYAGRPGTPWCADSVEEVVVDDADQPVSERDLRVMPGHVLRARVVDADGAARRGAIVQVSRAKSAAQPAVEFVLTTACDGDGRIELTGLPPGPWRLVLRRGEVQAEADVSESAAFVDVRL
ncbi:MAG: sigma-70 family RNA polymerase sigma factor [Planctomycetes bacterium]|nr:sigma-70 family RNA polymerase sigma factor [Planctomycetota bacterium]